MFHFYLLILNFMLFCTNKKKRLYNMGARGIVVGSGTMLQAGRSQVCFPMMSLDF
jgi:hypothetical protein